MRDLKFLTTFCGRRDFNVTANFFERRERFADCASLGTIPGGRFGLGLHGALLSTLIGLLAGVLRGAGAAERRVCEPGVGTIPGSAKKRIFLMRRSHQSPPRPDLGSSGEDG